MDGIERGVWTKSVQRYIHEVLGSCHESMIRTYLLKTRMTAFRQFNGSAVV